MGIEVTIDRAEFDRLRKVEAAAHRVRQLQREYFRTRSRDMLIASKEAEKTLDRLLEEER